ncbi:MAG TPA: hypothetical protein VGJ99_02335 [Actinomycetota bacterium]
MTRARLGALALLAVVSLGVASNAHAQDPPKREVFVFLVPEVSFEEMLGTPDVVSLSRAGGAGLITLGGGLPTEGETGVVPGEPPTVHFRWLDPMDEGGPEGVANTIRTTIEASNAERALVVVASTVSSPDMRAAKDEVHPIVVAEGAPTELFPDSGAQGSLTSDSTRRDGVVTDLDVVPTIASFLGEAAPADENGSPIEIIEGQPPFDLHERYLAQRRMYVPVGTAGGIYLAVAGLGGIAVLRLGRRVPERVRRAFGWACLSVAMLATSMLAAGHLPELTYAAVVPFVALVTVFGTLAFEPLEHRDVLLIPAGIGIAVLAFFAVEAILAWTAALTPFVGGSELDGGRFYGLPNVFIGLLIGASLWIAQRLRTLAGFALLVAVALFAGLPYLGANLGGGVSLFAAAGLWLAIRERERLGVWRGIGMVVGVTVLGTAVILAAHAISPFETHVTRFEEQAGGLAGVFERIGNRLQVGFDLIARNPFALIPVVGLPIAIAAVLHPPDALRPSLQRSPAWRDAILVTLLAGVVAYLANDSGPAAAGLAFGLGLGGLLGVSLLSEAGKMEET